MKQNKTVLYRRMIDRIVHFYTQIDEYGIGTGDGRIVYSDLIANIQTNIKEDISVLIEVFNVPKDQIMADIKTGMSERSAETIGSIINSK